MRRIAPNVSVLTFSVAVLVVPGDHANAQLAGFPGVVEGAAAPNATARSVRLVLREESRLWFEGDSNLHAWTCDAPFTAEITIDRAGAEGAPTRVEAASLSVPVLGIDCGNGKMNDNLQEALSANEHPFIRFRVNDATFVDPGVQGLFGVVARGELSVAGASVPIEIPVVASDTADGALNVTGRIQMLMTDFGIQPPTALLGLLKTKNEVLVLFDLMLGYAELEALLSEK